MAKILLSDLIWQKWIDIICVLDNCALYELFSMQGDMILIFLCILSHLSASYKLFSQVSLILQGAKYSEIFANQVK